MSRRRPTGGPDCSARLRALVLVEGVSDRRALVALAERRDRDLDAEGVCVMDMGGATNLGHFLARYGPQGGGVRLAGLYDAAEEPVIRRACVHAGLGLPRTRADLEGLGFVACIADLEDELIRALGTSRVEQVIAEQTELTLFRTFQQQPAQRGRRLEQQLRRFLGTRSGRKIRYAGLLVDALDLDRVPSPLDRVLASV